jgi:hypothetical protein
MKIGGEKERLLGSRITARLQTKFFDRYKTMFWIKKEYK